MHRHRRMQRGNASTAKAMMRLPSRLELNVDAPAQISFNHAIIISDYEKKQLSRKQHLPLPRVARICCANSSILSRKSVFSRLLGLGIMRWYTVLLLEDALSLSKL